MIVKIGQIGEKVAVDYLKTNGYKILEKNYRCYLGEVDIVARKNNRIHFVEVKTKRSSFLGSPEEMVVKSKQKRLIRLARHYVQANSISIDYQIDVIAIRPKNNDWKINHIKNAINEQ